MFGGFQPDAFQPDAYQNEAADAFQCIAFQPFAFQNSCEIAPADAFQCIAFQPFAFQASCEVTPTTDTPTAGGWGTAFYGRTPKRRPKEFADIPQDVIRVVERVAKRQIVEGPDVSPIQQMQELQGELRYDTNGDDVSTYYAYLQFMRKQLEEERAIATLMIMMLQ